MNQHKMNQQLFVFFVVFDDGKCDRDGDGDDNNSNVNCDGESGGDGGEYVDDCGR